MIELPKFIPVIHVISDDQAVEQANIAFDNGANGIFLIDHKRKARKLLETYEMVRNTHNDKWIGLNFLDLSSKEAILNAPKGIQALWIDDGGFRFNKEAENSQQPDAKFYHRYHAQRGLASDYKNFKLFSGFEFKYQQPAEDLPKAASWAMQYTDVPTTSGDGTGLAADIKKIEHIKSLLWNKPLAIASGITVENVEDYKPFIDCFMVATGISKTFDTFDPELIKQMSDKLLT